MACIITFARSWQTLIATRALGKAGIKVITSDVDSFATSFFSRYSVDNFLYTNPDLNEKKFIQDLIQKCKHYKKKYSEEIMILPVHKETYIISKYKKELEKHAKLCINDYDKILKVHNKKSISKLLKKTKIPHPNTYLLKDILQLYQLTPKLKFPVFIKVPECAASMGILKVSERDNLIYEYKNLVTKYNLHKDLPLIQESVPGKDYCVTAILNKGRLRAMMTYLNVKTYPYKSGTGVYRKTVAPKQMQAIAKSFLESINWHGLIELDFRMGPDKKPYLIEANPRFWGGLNQSISSNINYPLLAYNIAIDGDCPTITKINKSIQTENLFTAIMGLLDEIKNDEQKQLELQKLQKYWKNMFSSDFSINLKNFFIQLDRLNKKKYTTAKIMEFIERRPKVKDDLIDYNDPFIALGIFYPINLLLKYGKINKEILTGENPKQK